MIWEVVNYCYPPGLAVLNVVQVSNIKAQWLTNANKSQI